MDRFKPLPLFEEFLNQQEVQQGERIFLYKEQLRGIQITKDTKFTGGGNTLAPVKEKGWLPEGEYEISICDSNFVKLTGLTADNKLYWVSRYDFEEVKFDLVSPVVASGTDAVSDAKDALNDVDASKTKNAPYVFQTSKPAGTTSAEPGDKR